MQSLKLWWNERYEISNGTQTIRNSDVYIYRNNISRVIDTWECSIPLDRWHTTEERKWLCVRGILVVPQGYNTEHWVSVLLKKSGNFSALTR